jgi:S-adenosylmethionine:tRNA ribosyltransferase-isomerase
MKTDKFNYALPEHLIAQYPSKLRTDSKLLVAIESIKHEVFKDIENYINNGDLLILNQTSVIPARLYGKKNTGGKIEILLERFLSNNQTLTQIRSSRTPKEGAELVFSFQGQRFLATVEGRQENFFILNWSDDPKTLFEQYGQIPLPPYMNRAAEKLDEERYETIYADPNQKASVAAPTAGMHFDQELLNTLQNKGVEFGYVNLHVGSRNFSTSKNRSY